ncbi:MAG: xanthine dehydrogenase family protein molybdopterin-binding subunit [Thermoleophilaceae bacterium]
MTHPIGERVPRVEDRPLLTGSAGFVDDLELDGMMHARFFRSPLAHARIESLDLEAARSAAGVVAVYSAADLSLPPLHPPVENPEAFSPPRPLLAERVVRFVGEPLAVVVAESPYLAEDAAELIDARLEPLPVLVDPLEAAGAAPLHQHESNVLFDSVLGAGDVDAAFERAAAVVERTFHSPRYSATPMEARGLVAAPDGAGLRVWSSTQIPHRLASLLAEMFQLALEDVRVEAVDVGGGFGQKAHAYPEDVLAAWLALELRRPVKWLEDRSENLLAASHARDQVVRLRAAADADGRLLAVEADVVCDVGAYGVYPHGHILEALGTPAMIPGPYRLENYRAHTRSVCTNKAPEGAYRGVGLPVAAFVHERTMDLLAAELGLDRAEIRRRNLIASAELPYTTVTHQRYDSGDYGLALERALDAAGYAGFEDERRAARQRGRLIGIGIASYVEYTGMGSKVFHGRGMVGIAGHDRAWMRIDERGRVTVWTTLPAIGQGVATTFAQMAAAALGMSLADVVVARSDTAAGAGGGTGTFASRSAVSGGGAVAAAAGEMRGRLLAAAADKLEAAVEDLELVDGRVSVRGSPRRGVAVAELAAEDHGRFDSDAIFDQPLTVYPYATHVCAVEVDSETGHIELLRYVVVEDCGTLINPQIVEGQAHGAIAQGVGGALHESLVYDDQGQLLTASLMDYLVPTAMELPTVEIDHLAIPSPDSANGAKGVGEGGTLAPPAAITNAVCHALGVEINELPLTPELVRRAANMGNTRSTVARSPDDAAARPPDTGA